MTCCLGTGRRQTPQHDAMCQEWTVTFLGARRCTWPSAVSTCARASTASLCSSRVSCGKTLSQAICSLIKIVYWDGTGLCLFTKRLEHGVASTSPTAYSLPAFLAHSELGQSRHFSSYFTRIFASFRAKVRRCIPRRRAVSEMLKSECTKTSWMCSHSRFLIDVGRLESSTEASPSAR
jgi:hypothetical protein